MAKKCVKPDAYKRSILTEDMQHCFFCGRHPVQIHHIFGGFNRDKATEDDMIVPLCWECHVKLHNEHSQIMNYSLKKRAQVQWEWNYIKTHPDDSVEVFIKKANRAREAFRKRYGKSYL